MPPPSAFDSQTSSLLPLPVTVRQLLHGAVAPVFVKEVVSACREVGSGGASAAVDAMTDMLVRVAYSSAEFSKLLLMEILQQYKSVNPSELKRLSHLLLELMVSFVDNSVTAGKHLF